MKNKAIATCFFTAILCFIASFSAFALGISEIIIDRDSSQVTVKGSVSENRAFERITLTVYAGDTIPSLAYGDLSAVINKADIAVTDENGGFVFGPYTMRATEGYGNKIYTAVLSGINFSTSESYKKTFTFYIEADVRSAEIGRASCRERV